MKILSFFMTAACVVLASACTPYKLERPTMQEQYEQAMQSSSQSSVTAPPETSSSSSKKAALSEIVLVDQDGTAASSVAGLERLRAFGTKKIEGHLESAYLDIELSRGPGDDGKGWAAIGAYIAPLAHGEGFDYPNEEKYGTRLHFIDAVWNGKCIRALAPSSSFGVLSGHSNALRGVDFGAVPVTADDDGCDSSVRVLDLIEEVNSGGLVIGFWPSNPTYHYKVTLRYSGDVNVSSL